MSTPALGAGDEVRLGGGEAEQAVEADVAADLDVETEVAAERGVGLVSVTPGYGLSMVSVPLGLEYSRSMPGRQAPRLFALQSERPDSGCQISLWLRPKKNSWTWARASIVTRCLRGDVLPGDLLDADGDARLLLRVDAGLVGP